MIDVEPKYITFDCYGTLTKFGMSAVTRELFADRVAADRMEPTTPYYGYHEVNDLSGLPPLLGL